MNLTSCAPATTDTASNKNSIGRLATTDDCMVLCRITRVRRSHEMPSLIVQQIWQPRCLVGEFAELWVRSGTIGVLSAEGAARSIAER